MKNVKSVQAVSYAAADAIIAGYRNDPACKPLTDDLTGWTLGKEIHRDDVATLVYGARKSGTPARAIRQIKRFF